MEAWTKNLKLLHILNDNHESKYAAIEGEVEETNGEKRSAVLILEKTPFRFDDVVQLMKDNEQQFQVDFINDIYHRYNAQARSFCNDIKLACVYPATPLHIQKYSRKVMHLINETGHLYETVVRPFIEQNQLSPQWVHNIIEGKSEKERILLETDEFVIVPDFMWDGKDVASLHVLGFAKSQSIHSIRDLKPEHIPLLESFLDKPITLISEKYNISPKMIRAFFHYPPSFYHLHVHFTTFENRLCGCEVERAHLLQDVIDHIKLKSDYYQTKTLYYKLPINDALYKLVEEYELKKNEN